MAIISEREFAVKDEPMALVYLQCGRHALLRNEFEIAMENFERCYNARITRKLSVLLLNQMANCMGQLEYYDRQQGYLEDLCELDLSFENVRQLMNIYLATNNEVKRSAFAEKIRRLTAKDKSEERSAIFLLSQAKDHNEVLQRSLEWLKENPQDVDVARAVINVYMEMERIEDAFVFIRQLDAEFFKDKLLLELSALHRKMFDAEGGHDFLMRHMELYKENVMGVNRLAFTLITNTCYDGLLTGDDYVHWMWRAWESTKPQVALNVNFDNDTNYFRKIRVGIISYDFRMHSVGKFIMSLFDTVPTDTQIETYCYYTHPEHTDDYTEVIKSQADVFKHVGKYSDKQLRKELLSDRLDILVDLNGQTAGSRLGLVAERFAPVQATWMGFPFSSFHYNVDYNIGDYFFDPVDGETERYCTEKILRMDPSYMCFALGMDYYINPEPPQVKNQYVTFGMMNNPQKYSKEAIGLWQKCLEAVPGSRLLIQLSSYQGEFVEKKFRERLEKSGLDTSRVDIGRNYGQDGYYGTYNLVDVMLDSMPFGGGTTTSEAIWMGVPVIGCKYPMRHARMAYTFMSHVGLGHLCADSVETYPEKVREVSRNVDLLRDLRRNLRKKLRGMPLYDTGVFRRAFENAMRDAYADWCIEHKKPIDIDAYRKNDSRLLLDCIRAADIVVREIARERGRKEERLSAFITEYFEIHQVLMERLLVIFQNEAGMLVIAEKAAQLLELTESAPDAATAVSMISAIKSIITKFA